MDLWLAVGIFDPRRRGPLEEDRVKSFGPFDSADEAREFVNSLAMPPQVAWTVVPLRAPDTAIR